MGRKLAKKIGDNFTYYYGSYYGRHDGYDLIIKYDFASMLYNMYFCVKGKENIDKLNKILAEVDEFAVAKYKNNNLTITHACDASKYMPELVNSILDKVTKYLKDNKYKNLCHICNDSKKTLLANVDGNVNFICEDCIKNIDKSYKEELNEKKKIKENIPLGIIGAILGCIPGFIVWLILGYLMINPTVIGLIIMFGSAYFYKWMANSMKLPGLIISLIIGFIFIIFANELTNTYLLYSDYINQYNINFFDAYKAIPYYLSNSATFKASYNQSLFLAIMFGLFGGLTNLGVHRKYIASNKTKVLEGK